MPKGSEPPPPSGHKRTQGGVALGSAGAGVTWSCGPPEEALAPPPRHPESHSPAAPLSLSSPRHPTGRLPEQPRCSRAFSGQVLPPLCSPPSDVLCDQSERQPGWGRRPRKSWRKHNRLSQHPPPLLLPPTLALRKAQGDRQKDAGQTGGSHSAPVAQKRRTPLPSCGLVTK